MFVTLRTFLPILNAVQLALAFALTFALAFLSQPFLVLRPILSAVLLVVARLATVPAHDIPRAVLTLPLSRGRRAFLALSFAFAQRVNFHWIISSVLSIALAHCD